MKLAVSNIAWAPDDRAAAYGLLAARGITGLEIAPGLFFAGAADPFAPTPAEADTALAPMRAAGLELVSMQSLLFGVSGAALFDGPEKLDRFRSGLRRAIALAGRFAIPNLVFGSPGQRVIPDDMAEAAAWEFAAAVFAQLGKEASAAGTCLAIEPNPAAYGTNFLTHVDQAARFVARVGHPAVTLNFDLGALHMNGQFAQAPQMIADLLPCISHVHLSEPQLAPAPADSAQAAGVLAALIRAEYDRWISVEMKAAGLDALAGALDNLTAARQAA